MRLLILLLTLLFSPVAFADDDRPSPSLQSRDSGSTDAFPMKSSHAECAITGSIAEVSLTQVYTNTGTTAINATYLFPASTGAAVHGMSFTLNEVTTRAVIEKKEKARAIFEKAKKEDKSAGLLEQQRPNVFTMEIANILPGDEIVIKIDYSEILTPTAGTYEFVLPTSVGPRYRSANEGMAASKIAINPYLAPDSTDAAPEAPTSIISAAVAIQTPLPLQDLRCPSHVQAQTKFTSKNNATVQLPACPPDRDFILRYRLQDQKIATGLLVHYGEKTEDSTFLLHMEPPAEITPADIPARNFTFVIDTSGSMTGFPLDLAKTIFNNLTRQLKPTDTFNILLFAGGSRTYTKSPTPCTPENLGRAVSFLRNVRGGGGTELRAALDHSLSLAEQAGRDTANSLILITDGFITAEADVFDLMRERGKGVNLIPIGTGSSVNRHLMEGLAHFNGQAPFIVTNRGEIKEAGTRFLQTAGFPVLTNIKISGVGVHLTGRQPATHPDLFASSPLVMTGNFELNSRHEGPRRIRVTGTSGNGQAFSKLFALPAAGNNPALPLLRAREEVRALADYAQLFKDKETVEQVTRLGLKHSLLTPYTSFVAVSEEKRTVPGKATSVTQALPLPSGVTMGSPPIGKGGSVPEPSSTLLALITLLSIAFLRVR